MDEETWRLVCLANYVADHRNPQAFAAKLERRHGPELLTKLRELLREYRRG
jgi:hypothetical protein